MKTPNFVSGKVDIASQMHKSVQAIDQSRLVMQVIGYRSPKLSEAVIVPIPLLGVSAPTRFRGRQRTSTPRRLQGHIRLPCF